MTWTPFCWVRRPDPHVLGPNAYPKPNLNTLGFSHGRTQTPTFLGPNREGPTPKPILGLDADPKLKPLGSGLRTYPTPLWVRTRKYPNPNPIGSENKRTQTQTPLGPGTDPALSPIGSGHGAIPQPSWARKWKDPHPNLFWVQTLTPNPLGPDSEPILNPFGSRHGRTQTLLSSNRKGPIPKPILGPDMEGPKLNPLGSDSEPHPNPFRFKHGQTQTQKPLGPDPHSNPNSYWV